MPDVVSRIVSRSFLLAAGWLAMAAGPAPAAEPPRVVASIVPVHALAARLMEGVGQPTLLVRSGATPHAYQLRPSEAAALERADVVFWIGEPLETFLVRPLANLPSAGTRVVALFEAPGIELLPAREGGLWAAHDHDHDHDHDHGHGEDDHDSDEHGGDDHGHGLHDGPAAAIDPHLWLAPANARAMATAMTRTLAAADPEHKAVYEANAARLDASLVALEEELRRDLAPVHDRPFIVSHDAFQYLEHAFDLDAAGSITVSPERPPGARRVIELRQEISERGAVCVFTEPQIPDRLAATLVEGTDAAIGELDPLGTSSATTGPGTYEALMRRNAAELVRCLKQAATP